MPKSLHRGCRLLTAAILLPALTAFPACTSTEATQDDVVSTSYVRAVAGAIPDLPDIPHLPALEWEFSDGRYCLDEDGVDALLDYGENTLALLRHEQEAARRKLSLVRDALLHPLDYVADRSE